MPAADSPAAHLSQPNFIFRDMIPVAIIEWDTTLPGTRPANFAEFLWAFVRPNLYGDGELLAHMLRVTADAYGFPLPGAGVAAAMLAPSRSVDNHDRGSFCLLGQVQRPTIMKPADGSGA